MLMDRRTTLIVVAAAVIAAVVGAIGATAMSDARIRDGQARIDDVEARLAEFTLAQEVLAGDVRGLDRDVGTISQRLKGVGTTARIRLGAEHQPPGGGRFGGLQAFVETGTTAFGCVASMSETNIGNYGPFDVMCMPRAPVMDGRERKGVLIFVYRPLHSGDLGAMFPPSTIVEVTISQPGADRYATPIVCVIGAPQQC